MFKVKRKGNFANTQAILKNLKNKRVEGILNDYGNKGVQALIASTPKDTSRAASSWYYKLVKTRKGYQLAWANSDIENGVNIAILIQYGYSANGTYIQGRDYITPAIAPIIEQLNKALVRVYS